MKNFRHLIAIMAVVFAFGTAQAETTNHRSNRSKDPWQILMTTLDNHFVDTTDLCILSSFDDDVLNRITPDLAKAYQVKEKVDLSHALSLGDVICEFMRVKYAGRTGQTYDYYKYRFSNNLLYDQYVEKYPNSPYVTEMRLKSECLKQYSALLYCYSAEDYLNVLLTYETSNCPYGGFTNIASANNLSREYAALYIQSEFEENGNRYGGYDNYYNSYGGLYEGTPDPYEDFYNPELFDDDYELAALLTPNSKIGTSTLCLGNMGNTASLTISFSGPSDFDVVLGQGQYKWIDLQNGKYKIVVTSDNGEIWSPEHNDVTVEDGMYMAYWCDYNGKLLSSADTGIDNYIDDNAGEEMISSILERAKIVLSDLLELDLETSKKLLIHYYQQLLDPDEQNTEEIDLLYDGLTKDHIDLFINIFKWCLEELENEYDLGNSFQKPLIKL